MKADNVHHQKLENGLVLIGEEMPWLESAAFSISLPSGCLYDPAEQVGLANFTCEMVQRGCGTRNSREFVEALEWLGVSDSSSVNIFHSQFAGAMPASALKETLSIFSEMLRQPHLPAEQLEDGRQVCFQEIRAIEDDLSQKALNELRQRYFGDPLGRSSTGTMQSIQSISLDDIRNYFQRAYRPDGLILSVAGKIDWEPLLEHVNSLFEDWPARPLDASPTTDPQHGYHHIEFDSQQTHIALVYESTPYSNPDYFLARAAVGVLSGGYGSRLFTEVREKRGLCYSVGATLHSMIDRGFVIGYAGTTAERAQQTLDVMLQELEGIGNGITADELERVKVAIRSVLVMQQESSRSRASSNAGDWFLLGRVRSRDEINELVQGLTVEQVNEFLDRNRLGDFDLVTLGPEPLESVSGISKATT